MVRCCARQICYRRVPSVDSCGRCRRVCGEFLAGLDMILTTPKQISASFRNTRHVHLWGLAGHLVKAAFPSNMQYGRTTHWAARPVFLHGSALVLMPENRLGRTCLRLPWPSPPLRSCSSQCSTSRFGRGPLCINLHHHRSYDFSASRYVSGAKNPHVLRFSLIPENCCGFLQNVQFSGLPPKKWSKLAMSTP